MECLACGRENKSGNRFCSLCGVMLAGRRKVEDQFVATTCASCGNINEPADKFCGACGAKIDGRTPEVSAKDRAANGLAHEQLRVAKAAHSGHEDSPKLSEPPLVPSPLGGPSASAQEAALHDRNQNRSVSSMPTAKKNSAPATISGPSFLGLNSEPQNSEYLLDEDDSPSTGSGFRTLLMIVLIAMVAGLVFVQWRSHRAVPKPLEPAQSSSAGTPANQAENRLPSTPHDAQPQDSKISTSTDSSTSSGSEQHPAGSEAKEAESKVDAPKSNTGKSAAATPAEELARKDAESAEISKPITKNDGPSGPKEKPSEEPKHPSMSLVWAQQYLQGRGVRQNCSQGLKYLKTATDQNDPQAAVQMAALYASGHCVHQDLVQAYRWFTSASELQPTNRLIDKNLTWLWAEMTPAQRSQISK